MIGLSLAQAALPVATTFAARAVMARAAQPVHQAGVLDAVLAVLVLGALLTGQQLVTVVMEPLRLWSGKLIDGRFRQEVVGLALAPVGVAHMEDSDRAGRFATAATHWLGFTPGQAALARLSVVSQTVAVLACAVIVARVSPWAAAAVLVLIVVRRVVMQRLFVGPGSLWSRSAELGRRVQHWRTFGTRPETGKEIRIFGLQAWTARRYRDAVLDQNEPIWTARNQIVWSNWLPLAAGAAAMTVGLLGLLFARARTDAGEVAQYLVALLAMLAAGSAGWEGFALVHGTVPLAVERGLRKELEEITEPRDPARTDRLDGPAPGDGKAPPGLRFEGVAFGYPGRGTPVLAGLNLDVRPGEVMALVGVNGAGKTTLTKLLARLYEPDSGRILADGVDILGIPADQWRAQLAVVVQGFLRYDLSLRQNVALGAPERLPDDSFFAEVVDELALDDIVRTLPNGWDTPLSRARTNGTELSGGQWQRIALARAVFALRAGRRILVLDEPTAHLDAEAEFAIFQQVIGQMRGVTVLFISHRLSTVRLADRIAVLRDGRVNEIGTHAELLKSGQDYAQMFDLQAQAFTGEPSPEASR
ncbi:ABC transporter ATP-binding protein [Streptomyces sp. NPDC051572]|uniref:ABC transporter ATP-binding protein n=1 Tax=unclassified Streptomyces TaxID=2593676 RepID=UPI00344FFB4C